MTQNIQFFMPWTLCHTQCHDNKDEKELIRNITGFPTIINTFSQNINTFSQNINTFSQYINTFSQ